jgi:tetratricopeptide (TPR) repeat protein
MNPESSGLESVHSPYIGACVEKHDFAAAFTEADRLVMAVRAAPEESRGQTLSYHLNTRGFLHLQLGRYEEALTDCLEARQMNPDLDQNNLMLARLFFHYYDSVIVPEMERLREGLSAQACRNIAMAYHDTEFYAHAASYFQLAISVAEPEALPELYNSLGGSYLGSGHLIEAFVASAKALLLAPEFDKTNYLLSLWQLQGMGQDPGAFMPGYPLVVGTQAAGQRDELVYYLRKDYSSCLERFEQIVADARAQVSPQSGAGTVPPAEDRARRLPGYLNHRALCHLNLGHLDEAIADSLEARRLDPNLGHANLRVAQFFKEKYESSLKPLFDKLKRGISAEGYNQIGLFFFKHGFQAHAAMYFQLAASISEELVQAEALNNLAGAYLDSGHTIEALRASSRALLLNPHISKANHKQACIRLKPMGLDADRLLEDRFSSLRE